jgi:hypothetical protein
MFGRIHLRPHWFLLAASVSTAVGLLGASSSAAVPDSGASTNNDDNEAVYRDGYQGAAGYLPVFHPTPLTAAEATTARTSLYPTSGGKTPSPSNIELEFPNQFKLQIACFGRGLDPRGPYAEPPQAPYLIPGNVAAMTFGTHVLRGGGLYIATSPGGFNNTVTGTQNLNPETGPIVTEENTAGVYEVALGNDGTCTTIRTVGGGLEKAGSNGGPHPEFGDFGVNIDGLSFHDGSLYTDDFTGGPEGARSGPNFSAGRIHRVDPRTGTRVALIANLPSEGDHQNDAFVFFNEQGHTWVEFEQGTTTNSGTVDGEGLGDIPCFDVELTPAGEQFFPFTMGYKRTVHNLPGGAPLVDGSIGANSGHIVRGDAALQWLDHGCAGGREHQRRWDQLHAPAHGLGIPQSIRDGRGAQGRAGRGWRTGLDQQRCRCPRAKAASQWRRRCLAIRSQWHAAAQLGLANPHQLLLLGRSAVRAGQ